MSVKEHIGCCGFYYCKKCAYYTGEIVQVAQNLLTYFEKYKSLEILSRMHTEFHYHESKESLQWLTKRNPCNGCRFDGEWSWWADCPIRDCVTEKGIHFCFECENYPCDIIEKNFMKEKILRANTFLENHVPHESDYDPVLKNKN